MEIYTKRQLYRKHPKAIECLMKKLGIEYCPPWDKSKRAPCVEQILKWQEKHVAHKDAFGKGHNLSNVATENQELGQAGMGQTRPFLQHAANSIKTSVYSVRKSTSSESESTTEEVEDTAAVVWKPFQRHEPCADDKEVPTKDDEKRCVDAKSQCTEPAVSCRESIADPGDELIDFDPEALHPRRNATDRNLLANLGIYELAPTRLNPSRHHPKSAEESQDAVNVASDQSGNRASVKLGNAITRNILAAPGKAYPAGLHLEPGVSTSVNPLDFFKTFCPATLKSGSDTISPYEPKIELSDGSQLSPFIAHLLLTSQLPLPETIQRSEHKALLNELVDKAKTNTTLSVTSHSVGATGKGNKYSAAQKYRTMEERIAKLEADIKERNDEIKEQKVVNGNFHRRLIEVREDNEDLYKQMSKLKSSTESHSKRLDALGTMAHTGRHLRNRFFETFKRDVLKVAFRQQIIRLGDIQAHGGRCLEDAQLFEEIDGQPRLRKDEDEDTYLALYGLPINVVLSLKSYTKFVELIDRRGTIASTKELENLEDQKKAFFDMVDDCVMSFITKLSLKERSEAFEPWKGKLHEEAGKIRLEFKVLQRQGKARRKAEMEKKGEVYVDEDEI